jgi:hypothetical protein
MLSIVVTGSLYEQGFPRDRPLRSSPDKEECFFMLEALEDSFTTNNDVRADKVTDIQ